MIKTRIAPSPTGDPHIGTAYSALFNYAFAKHNNGKFLLRIEDTDRARFQEGSELKIIESLNWLGLKYDDHPFKQSDRLSLYQKSAKDLVENGFAYYCDCTVERLNKMRKDQQSKGELSRYDKKCLKNPPKIEKNKTVVIRLKVPEKGQIKFKDLIKGEISFKFKDVDDSVLLKSDGWPTYHLAVVVDDSDMKISHVIRAEEWLSSTPKHLLIYRYLNKKAPEYAHLPLLRNKDKSKISKRKNPVSLNWYKEEGYLPEAILNYLSLMGWSMKDGREIFDLRDFVENIDLNRVDSAGPIFDIQKLDWLNGEWIRKSSNEDLVKRIKQHSHRNEDQIKIVLPLIKDRIKKLSEFDTLTNYFFDEVILKKSEIKPVSKSDAETFQVLSEILMSLEKIRTWDRKNIENVLDLQPDLVRWSKKDLFQTLRYIICGTRATPPLFDVLLIVGKNQTLRRLTGAIEQLRLYQ